ncbi:MAG: alpha/beta-type small acid-soluble spore protein [Thermaerobacter sp.]|nr:alpha/beta-type small acid-soluble spore protein [Thermaerobacter sp.]
MLPREHLDQFKYEVANELGIDLKHGYNGDITAREAGAIGGRIGGNMVKVMIRMAEEAMANGQG